MAELGLEVDCTVLEASTGANTLTVGLGLALVKEAPMCLGKARLRWVPGSACAC